MIVYVKFWSVGAGIIRFGRGGSSLPSGIEFGRSRTGEGSSGGEEEGGGTGDATIGFRQVDRRLQPQEGALD